MNRPLTRIYKRIDDFLRQFPFPAENFQMSQYIEIETKNRETLPIKATSFDE